MHFRYSGRSRRFSCSSALRAPPSPAAPGRPFRFDELAKAGRVGGFSVSPDGQWLVYTVGTPDVEENRTPLRPLAAVPLGRRASPPDLRREARLRPEILSRRRPDRLSVQPRRRIADLPPGSLRRGAGEGLLVSRRHRGLPVVARREVVRLHGQCLSRLRRRRLQREEVPGAGEVEDEGEGGRAAPLPALGRLEGRPADAHLERARLGAGLRRCRPDPRRPRRSPFSIGGGGDYDVSPDGRDLVYASNPDRVEALSTNGDIWTASFDGKEKPRDLTEANKAYDGTPKFSPDGKWIAWRSQKRPGFESDRFTLMLFERATGKTRALTDDFDEWVEGFTWAPDSRSIYFTSHAGARGAIFRVGLEGKPAEIWRGGSASGLTVSRDGRRLVFSSGTLSRAPEIWSAGADGKGAAPVTHVNDAFWKEVEMGEVSERMTRSADGRTSRPGSSSRRASIPRRNIRRCSSFTAARRAPGPTPGPRVGIRRSGRPTVTSSTPPIRAARPASARSSWTRSPATGAERSMTT